MTIEVGVFHWRRESPNELGDAGGYKWGDYPVAQDKAFISWLEGVARKLDPASQFDFSKVPEVLLSAGNSGRLRELPSLGLMSHPFEMSSSGLGLIAIGFFLYSPPTGAILVEYVPKLEEFLTKKVNSVSPEQLNRHRELEKLFQGYQQRYATAF